MQQTKAEITQLQEIAALKSTFARLDVFALGVSIGTLIGGIVLIATVVLIFLGPTNGGHIGEHLGLLAYFMPGYSVSLAGSLIGSLYGFIAGAAIGALVAIIWNTSQQAQLLLIASRLLFDRSID